MHDIDHGVGQTAGDFVAADRVPSVKDCKLQFIGKHRKPFPFIQKKRGFFIPQFIEFVGHQAGRGYSQDNVGHITVSLATAWNVKVGELGLGPQGVEGFAR